MEINIQQNVNGEFHNRIWDYAIINKFQLTPSYCRRIRMIADK